MRTFRFVLAALAMTALIALPAAQAVAQSNPFLVTPVESFSGSASGVVDDTSCFLVKYVGTTVGKPTVEVAAGGDMTFKIAGSADTTTGSPNLDGVFDLSTPAAAVDTVGELVTKINTTGSNWRAVIVSCLAADLTDNTMDDVAATDASGPKGVAITREATSASASAVFSAQVAALPAGAHTNIAFFLSGSPIGGPSGSTKINPNPLANHQTFVQHIREKITSTGTVALTEILCVNRTYSSNGTLTETTRSLFAVTGAATTVEAVNNFHAGPQVCAVGEFVVLRQRTGTDLTAAQLGISGFSVVRK